MKEEWKILALLGKEALEVKFQKHLMVQKTV
jgi:hypothetical protein